MTLLVRGDSLARSMSDYLIREIEATGNSPCGCTPRSPTATASASLQSLTLCDKRRGRTDACPGRALFVLIGGEPRTQWLPAAVQLAGLHPDRAGRARGTGRTEPVAAGPRRRSRWRLGARGFRRGRRPLPVDQAGGLGRRRRRDRGRLVQEYLANASAAA